MYSSQVLDHFQNPRNVGDLADASASAQVENPACGDVLRLSLRVDDGTITAASFRAKGCVPSIACASKLTEMLQGRTIDQAAALSREELAAELGGLPTASTHAGQLAIDALRKALSSIGR